MRNVWLEKALYWETCLFISYFNFHCFFRHEGNFKLESDLFKRHPALVNLEFNQQKLSKWFYFSENLPNTSVNIDYWLNHMVILAAFRTTATHSSALLNVIWFSAGRVNVRSPKSCNGEKLGEGQMCDLDFTVLFMDGGLSRRVHVFDIQLFTSVITPVVLNHTSLWRSFIREPVQKVTQYFWSSKLFLPHHVIINFLTHMLLTPFFPPSVLLF